MCVLLALFYPLHNGDILSNTLHEMCVLLELFDP